jgi:alginate O-acetyltransferase complex protein AlgI
MWDYVLGSWSHVTFVDRIFIFGFLPVTVFAFWLATRSANGLLPPAVLIGASLTFYASWGVTFLTILSLSMAFNYLTRLTMLAISENNASARKWTLFAIVSGNLAALFAFKYFDLFIGTFSDLLGKAHQPLRLVIPLGISFYTFQEITLAVDAHRGVPRIGLIKYVLFIVFFPHLIAGPLVHHREMVPQFSAFKVVLSSLMVGVSLFSIGLFKKVCVADPLALIVQSVFDRDPSSTLQMGWAWAGALAYAFQIYFDFSGYSDMALGLGRLFGVRLPINFYSPYQARSITDFWHRWHMTLSRFLREYLYIPLGGNRRGDVRRDFNLLFVMLVGGLWHGANWTFVIWGGLHGLFLIAHRGWQQIINPPMGVGVARLLTFCCVVWAWVPFRAVDISQTIRIWKTMVGLNGVESFVLTTADRDQLRQCFETLSCHVPSAFSLVGAFCLMLVLYTFCVMLPNAAQLLNLDHPWPAARGFLPDNKVSLRWYPNATWGAIIGLAFGVSMLVSRQVPQEFLYWRF